MGVVHIILQGRRLRYIVIGTHFLAILLSGCIFFPLGSVFNFLKSECILFADLVFQIQTSDNFTLIDLDITQSIWGDIQYCYYCTYSPVTTAIHGIIWSWIYIQMSELHKKNEALCYLLISCVFHTTFSVVILVSSFILTIGISNFCANIEDIIKNSMTCKETEEVIWSGNEDVYYFYTRLQVAEISSWLLTVVLLVQSVLAGYFGGKLVMDKTFENEKTEKKTDYSYLNTNLTNYYEDASVNQETGSMVFNQDMESSTTMKDQYDKL